MRMLRRIVYSIVKVLTSHVRKVTKNSLSQLRQGFILDVPVSHDQIFSPQTTGIVKCVAKHVEDARVSSEMHMTKVGLLPIQVRKAVTVNKVLSDAYQSHM